MSLKTTQGWLGYGSSGTSSADQLESRNGVLLLPQDSVVIDESSRYGKKLGESTFATVYVGMHMGKERAIKVFHLRSDSTLDKAQEEYEKLNSLKHSNIVCVYGMWKDPYKGRNAPAIVMELYDHSLHEYIQQYHPRGSITREHKLKILHDITCAMVFLHSQNIIHGDLRTPNVLIKRNEDELTAKLTDFGMAQMLDPQHNSHFTTSAADVDYLPPEVFNHKDQKDRKKNQAKLTTQVDVFMFGPVAIELACGEFPKPTTKLDVHEGKVVRTYTEIERRDQYLTKVKESDRAITDVIVKECLAENPEDRGTFLDLQRIVKGFQWQNNQPDDFEELRYGQAQQATTTLAGDFILEHLRDYYRKTEEEHSNYEWKEEKAKYEQMVEELNPQIAAALTEENGKIQALWKEDKKAATMQKYRCEELQRKLESSKQENKARGEELKATQFELKASQSGVNQVKSMLEKERASLQSEVQSKEKECSLLRSAETRLNKLKQDHESLQQKLKTTESELSHLKLEQSRTSSDMKGKDADLTIKQDSILQLRSDLKEAKDSIQARDVDIRKLGDEVMGLKEAIQFTENELRETNTKASQDQTTISELQTKRNSQAAEDSQKRQDIERPLLVEINTLKERLSQREADLLSSSGRISELERDIDASKAHSAELQSELNHTDTGLTSTRAELDTALAGLSNTQEELSNTQEELSNTQEELSNTQVKLRKAQKQNEPSSIRCQELEQQCQKLRQHTIIIAELESAQSRLQKSEEDLNQQVEVLKSERDAAQRQVQDFDRGSRDLKLKLQKTQSDYENEQRNCERERDTTKGLRAENAQLVDRMSSLEREVQALMDKGSHRREFMQQMVKSMQDKVAKVRSDLDQERSRQSDLKDSRSAELLLTRSYIVRLLKTELVSRATELQKCKDKVQKCKDKFQKCKDELQMCRDELQKCRNELKTTTTERDWLSQRIAMQQNMDQHFHRLQEQMKRNMVEIVAKVIANVHEVSAGVSELSKEVQQFPDQTSSTSSVQQNLTAPAPVSKNLTEDGTRPQEMLCMSQPQTGVPNALVTRHDKHVRTTYTGQTSRTPLLQGPADFNVKSFMDGCKDDFLNDVKAKPIAAYLKSENVIPPQLNKDIDGADTKKGTLLLFEHLKDQGSPESILILCKVMEESADGHPRMIIFAKVLKDKLNKCPH